VAEIFSQFSAFSVFLAIAGLGFLFLLMSLIFGEVFEHLGSGWDHDLGHGGPTFLSVRILSVFVTAFGGFGAIGIHYGLSLLGASGVGFVSGLFFATLIYLFARFLYGQQVSTEVHASDVVGKSARIIVPIPKDGIGQVRCQIGEELVDRMARTRDGQPLPENAIVRIEETLGEIVIVKPQ